MALPQVRLLPYLIQHLYFPLSLPRTKPSGLLNTFFPPFSRNHQTDAILKGTFDTTNIDPIEEVSLFLCTMAIPTSLQGIDSAIDITTTAPDFQQSFKKLPSIQHPAPWVAISPTIKFSPGTRNYRTFSPLSLLFHSVLDSPPNDGSPQSKSWWKRFPATLKFIDCESFNFLRLTRTLPCSEHFGAGDYSITPFHTMP